MHADGTVVLLILRWVILDSSLCSGIPGRAAAPAGPDTRRRKLLLYAGGRGMAQQEAAQISGRLAAPVDFVRHSASRFKQLIKDIITYRK